MIMAVREQGQPPVFTAAAREGGRPEVSRAGGPAHVSGLDLCCSAGSGPRAEFFPTPRRKRLR
jgi:hypothetical protein